MGVISCFHVHAHLLIVLPFGPRNQLSGSDSLSLSTQDQYAIAIIDDDADSMSDCYSPHISCHDYMYIKPSDSVFLLSIVLLVFIGSTPTKQTTLLSNHQLLTSFIHPPNVQLSAMMRASLIYAFLALAGAPTGMAVPAAPSVPAAPASPAVPSSIPLSTLKASNESYRGVLRREDIPHGVEIRGIDDVGRVAEHSDNPAAILKRSDCNGSGWCGTTSRDRCSAAIQVCVSFVYLSTAIVISMSIIQDQ